MKQKPLTADQLRSLLNKHGSLIAIARATGRTPSSIYNRASVLGVRADGSDDDVGTGDTADNAADATLGTAPRQEIEVDETTGTVSAKFVEPLDPNEILTNDELLVRAKLDPKEWRVEKRRQSTWEQQAAEGEVVVMRSLRVTYGLIPETIRDEVYPAFGGAPVTVKQPNRLKANERDGRRLIVVLSDFHAPFHDPDLLSATKQALLDSQPDELIVNGDLVDWPTVGGKPQNTKHCQASANECIQAGGEILAELKSSVPEDCKFVLLPGNHDAWLSRYLYYRAGAASDLCVAGSDVPVWSLRNLLQLEQIGIEMIGEEELWQQSTYALSERLVVTHGRSVKKRSGASVIANMEQAEYASITGHTHRQGAVSLTVINADRRHKILQGAECGGMFRMPTSPESWPTYMPHDNLDWQPGWLSVMMEPDGHYGIDLASWQNGVLMWRGRRY